MICFFSRVYGEGSVLDLTPESSSVLEHMAAICWRNAVHEQST